MNELWQAIVYAETDDYKLFCKWQGEPLDGGWIGGNPHYIKCDEKNDSKPEMTKEYRLMFKLPLSEVEELEDKLKKAGFTHISSDYPLDI